MQLRAQLYMGVASKLATKWGSSYCEVMGWVQSRLSFAILMATNWYVHASRVRWRSGFGMEDGAGQDDALEWNGTQSGVYFSML